MNAQYEAVTSEACTTDCLRYAKGTCGYRYDQKHQCPRWVAFASAAGDRCGGCSFFEGCQEIGNTKPNDPACIMFARDSEIF